jgi:hypothetical protein
MCGVTCAPSDTLMRAQWEYIELASYVRFTCPPLIVPGLKGA